MANYRQSYCVHRKYNMWDSVVTSNARKLIEFSDEYYYYY